MTSYCLNIDLRLNYCLNIDLTLNKYLLYSDSTSVNNYLILTGFDLISQFYKIIVLDKTL